MTDAFDVTKPNVARIYNALQDGKDNFARDREAAGAIKEMAADAQGAAHDNRAFLGRAVRFLAGEAGISQFVDIGSGMPAVENTHEIAQRINPGARIAYLDNDPVVLGHARAILSDKRAGMIALPGDLRNPLELLGDPVLRDFIDFGQPVAIMLLAVLHFVEDPLAHEVVSIIMERVPAGSFLAISHASADEATPEEVGTINAIYRQAGTPIFLRRRDEITAFFDGLELVEPGVTDMNEWRNPAHRPARTIGYGGIAIKNA
jgi:SAM-dependent methyltransferase